MYRFELPDIGEGVAEAEVIEWKVKEGEIVAEDEVFIELMTDKATIEIPSPRGGRVHKLCFAEGDIVPVGAVLIEIETGDAASASSAAAPHAGITAAPTPEVAAEPQSGLEPERAAEPPRSTPPPPTPVAAAAPRVAGAAHPPVPPARPTAHRASGAPDELAPRAVPAVRELAKRLGIDLASVTGSGPNGRVMRRDLEEAAAGNAPSPAPAESNPPLHATTSPVARTNGSAAIAPADAAGADANAAVAVTAPPETVRAADPADWERIPLRGMRRAIAKHMSESRRRAAHFTYADEVDVSALLAARDAAIASQNIDPISLLAFVCRAVVRALPDFPMLNASIDDEREEIVLKKTVHLGIAVAADDALVVPVIPNAAQLSTVGLAHAITSLAERARDGDLGPTELKGSTFTVTSLGRIGGILSTPILNHPESGILAVGAVRELPRYIEGELLPRSILNLSISVDHRIADGLMAANFIQGIRSILESADFPDLLSST